MLSSQFYREMDSTGIFVGLNTLSRVDRIPRYLEHMKVQVPSVAIAVERMTTKRNKEPYS